MVEDKFFDGVGNIAVQGAVARVELTRVVKLNAEAGKAPAQEVDMRLVLPLDALLRMYQALGQIVGQMEEKGVVKKRDAAASASTIGVQ
jgi:hypothetical protein